VSCPELTAIDLVTYQERAGSITRAATVLAELVEKTDFGQRGAEFVKVAPVACFQRLGYILEEVLEEPAHNEKAYLTAFVQKELGAKEAKFLDKGMRVEYK
jgi:hypothetical protein